MSYSRFAIYFILPDGPLADFGARWLGWDIVRGRDTPQFDMPGLDDITMTPRKYGFHGTLKPPFRLADGYTSEDLERAVGVLGTSMKRATCEGLELSRIGSFLALTPFGDTGELQRLASSCVRVLDVFRAPAGKAEIARRRAAGLTARQESLLTLWGYPYVMEEFRFHLTLTGKIAPQSISDWVDKVKRRLPALPAPFCVDEIALCGEREDGRFELIHRYTLAG